MVRLVYHGELRDLVGCAEEEIDAASMRDVFRYIANRHGKKAGKIAKSGLVTRDGRKVMDVNEGLSPSSVVGFHPLCTGG